jgi:hypothetical protein
MIKANEIQIVSIKDVKLNPKNRNKHPKEQIERLAEIIKYQGFRNPLIISSRTGLVVAGHGRYEAAKKLKLKEVPIMVQEFESEEQEYAAQVSDNAIASWAELDLSGINTDVPDLGPDFNIDLLGIKDFVLEPAEKFEAQSDEDEVPEHVEPKTKLGDIYQLGRHRLMCGDSTSIIDVDKLMFLQSADMLLTDPPYGVKAVKNGTIGGGGIVRPGRYSEIIGDDTINTAKDVYNLAIGMNIPVIVLWGGNYYSEFCPPTSGWLVWDKLGDTNSNNFADCELAWTNLSKPARIHKQMWRGMIKQGESGKRIHPTQKPVELSSWAIEVTNKEAKNILDLFGGSGSTLIACEKTNRKCFMMELDPYYCDVIVARWEKYTGQKAELINA